jgi:hypothetical protein
MAAHITASLVDPVSPAQAHAESGARFAGVVEAGGDPYNGGLAKS